MTLSEIAVQELPAQHTAVVRHRITMAEVQQIPGWLGTTYEAVQATGHEPAGLPFVRTLEMGEQSMDIEVGWPVEAPIATSGDVHASMLPAGPAAVGSYFGPYEEIGRAYEAIVAWCAEHGREIAGAPWESYITDPHAEPDPAKWQTDVHFPVAP